MIYQFFIFGGIWFYGLCLAELIFLFIAIFKDSFISTTLSLIVFVLLISLFGNVHVVDYVRDNPIEILKYIGVYFCGGIIWSFIKFYFYAINIKRNYYNEKERYFQKEELEKMTDEEKMEKFKSFYKNYNSTPTFNDCKKLILPWMCYWPISLLISLLNDVVRNIFIEIREMLSGFYKKIYDSILGNLLSELK